MKRLIASLVLAFSAYTGYAQCSTGVAPAGTCSATSYAYSTVQTFQTTCGGILRNVVVPNISTFSDDLRNSGAFVTPRILSATGTVLATGPATDQWYPGNTLTFDLGCANLTLAANTTYRLEFLASFTTITPLQLILFCRSTSSVYASGGYIEDGAAPTTYPNSDLYGWTVNLTNGNIAAASTSATQTITAPCTSFYNATPELIATIQPTGAAMGSTTAKVFVQSTAPTFNTKPYVRRYYDIAPATNAATATATITLYFTQADFDNYNLIRGTLPALPTGPSDAAGIAALRITQEHGTSATGAPGTFTGWSGSGAANVLKTPTSVVWNATASRWEVTLSVTGFSGFFAHSGSSAPLPVKLISFNATATGAATQLSWASAVESAGTLYTAERSADGSSFNAIASVNGKGDNSTYTIEDRVPVNAVAYYRLKMTEEGGEVTYSDIVMVRGGINTGSISIAPQPVAGTLRITNTDAALMGGGAVITDMRGSEVARFTIEAINTVDAGNWPAGIYILRLPTGGVMRIVKQ